MAEKVKVTVRIEEKIGLPQYSNITICGEAETYVDDDSISRRVALENLAQDIEQDILAEERDKIYETVFEAKKKATS